MSNIPYQFVPIPEYFWKYGWFRNPKMIVFVTWCFHKCSCYEKKEIHDKREIHLQPFEFIMGKGKCSKETGLSEQEIKTLIHHLSTNESGPLLKKTSNSATGRFTSYVWSTDLFCKSTNRLNEKSTDSSTDSLMNKSTDNNTTQDISRNNIYKSTNRLFDEQINRLINRNLESEDESLKKESDKEKRKSPAFRSLSFSNEDFETICKYCEYKNLPIEEKTIRVWLKKYSVERITSNLGLILQRNEPFSIRLLECALKDDYAGEPERILQNRNFAMNFKRKNQWSTLSITQQYCRCEERGESLSFKLHPQTFEEVLQTMYSIAKEMYA